jgi:MFS family permease
MCSFYGIADNIWSGTVVAAYLKELFGESNSAVGYVEASNGLAGLFTALPVGYLADKYKRSSICKFGAVTLVVTAVVHSGVMYWIGDEAPPAGSSKSHTAMCLFLAVMFLWGLSGGIVNGPLQALYADSTPAGDRSK